jgi:LCP family protein required for cell wall assembly
MGSGKISDIWTPPFGGKRIVRILLLGEDNSGVRAKTGGLTDTIFLISLNLDTKQVAGVSIPRDTRVDLNGYGGVCKINSAIKVGGPSLTCMAVEELTGVHPDYYLKTNLDGFKKTVDLVGGVDIDVEKNMNYDDNWGNLHIHLRKGNRHLNGENAMGYVRFRHDKLGDITRMERQQKFLRALAKRALEAQNLPRLPKIISSVRSNISTDLTNKDLLTLAKLVGSMEEGQVKAATLPAVPENISGISYMIADTEKIPEFMQEMFAQTLPSLPSVEVLNGSGIPGGGMRVADALRAQGYKVVSVGNADSFAYRSSRITGNKDKLAGLDNIGRIVNSAEIETRVDPSAKADVTIIVGKDCAVAAGRE